MNVLRKCSPASWLLFLLICTLLALTSRGATVQSDGVKALFKNPPREYSTGPLWVWNDLLTEQQIRDTLRDLAGQKVKQVWVHPRPGLMTPYLSDDWFRLWKVALNEAERLDMNVWIYDENSYPSGFAGGWVPELMPESRGRGLALRETNTAPKWSDDLVGVYRLDDDSLRERHRQGQSRRGVAGGALPRGHRSAREELALAWQPVLRESALARRDGEVPRGDDGALPARDREAVRQARARRLHRRAEHSPRRRSAVERDPAAGVPEALGLQPARPLAQPDAAQSATGARSGTITSRS